MATSVSRDKVGAPDQRRVLTGGAIAFFLLAVAALVMGNAFVTVLALLCTFALVLGAAFGRRIFPGGGPSAPADDDDEG